MERPKKLNKEVWDYCDYLERRLTQYDTHKTLASFYLGIKNQMDQISRLMKTVVIDENMLRDKDDRFTDRITKFQEKAKNLAETLVYLREKIDPEVVKQVEQEDGSIYEELINELRLNATTI